MRNAVPIGVLCFLMVVPSGTRAQEDGVDDPASEDGVTLTDYLTALTERRLISEETGSLESLRALVRKGEQLFLDGRHDRAALVLFEVAESPRFSDFMELDEFRGAEYMLASSLHRLGALRSATKHLDRILVRGLDDPYFGPAYRRYVDVALQSGDLQGAIVAMEALALGPLPEDAENEFRYLRGRERFDAGDSDAADTEFAEITRRSRFYANAQYLRGVMAAGAGDLDNAENLFCSIVETGAQDRYSFYVDQRFFEVRDLAHLGLGRVAHEGRRGDDAFYYYFQVPNDSERVAEALFESAFSMYEGEDLDTSMDLLDQLEVRFPQSPFVDEAALLRGYIHLGRCEFEEANEEFQHFMQRFEPVREEVARILDNPTRMDQLYEELLAEEQAQVPERAELSTVHGMLLSLLRVDSAFYRFHSNVRILDAESARAGRLSNELGALRARVDGTDAPRPAASIHQAYDEAAELRSELEGARAIVRGLTEQLDAMRSSDSPPARSELRPLYQALQRLGRQVRDLEARLGNAFSETSSGTDEPIVGSGLDALLRRDAQAAERLPARVATLRQQLVQAAGMEALRALRQHDARLGDGLRRARIGRIDAVMGSKRRIEIQIESLSAGRFPAELQDPLMIQGLLRDDEEYWPFEGELWQDEFEQTDPVASE